MKAIKMDTSADSAKEIRDKVADILPHVRLVNPFEVLVGIYKRPEKTAGGLILTDKTRGEDIWQGKIGLVLKVGRLAFTEDTENHWDTIPKLGDWVALRVGDTWQLILGEQNCRMVRDQHVRFVIDSPDVVY